MDFVPYDHFTDIQKTVVDYKLQTPTLTWREWMDKCLSELGIKFTPLTLMRFVKKDSNGLSMGT